ncbi:MAG: PPC domain-containing DNA-binding protein [Pyrinomonadaceae bacterium]
MQRYDYQVWLMTKRVTRPTLLLAALVALCAADAGARQAPPTAPAPKSSPTVEAFASGRLKAYALRLRPGQDLRRELEKFAKAQRLQAGVVLTAVGSLTKAALRLADQPEATQFEGKFELVSLVGTLSPDGPHLHVSLSDKTGRTIGGHLVEGCTVYTTVELVIGEIEGVRFTREQDAESGYKELRVTRRAPRRVRR